MKKTIGKFLMLTALAGTISSGFAMKKEINEMSESEKLTTFGANAVSYQALFFNPKYVNPATKAEDPTIILQLVVDRFNKNKIIEELDALDISLNTTTKEAFFEILDDTLSQTKVSQNMIDDIKEVTNRVIAGNIDDVELKKLVIGTFLNDSALKDDFFSNDVASSLFQVLLIKEKIALLESQMSEIDDRSKEFVEKDLNTIAAVLFESSKPLVEQQILKVFSEYKTSKDLEISNLRQELSTAKTTQVSQPVKSQYQSRFANKEEQGERKPSGQKLAQTGYVSKYARKEDVRAPEPVRESSVQKSNVTQQASTGYVSKYASKEEVRVPEQVRAPSGQKSNVTQQASTGYVSKYTRNS